MGKPRSVSILISGFDTELWPRAGTVGEGSIFTYNTPVSLNETNYVTFDLGMWVQSRNVYAKRHLHITTMMYTRINLHADESESFFELFKRMLNLNKLWGHYWRKKHGSK